MRVFATVALMLVCAAGQLDGAGCRCVHLAEAEHSDHAADTCCPGQETPCGGLDMCGCCQTVAGVTPAVDLAEVPGQAAPSSPSPVVSAPAEAARELLRPPIA